MNKFLIRRAISNDLLSATWHKDIIGNSSIKLKSLAQLIAKSCLKSQFIASLIKESIKLLLQYK